MSYNDKPMNYDLVLTNTVLTKLAEFTLWLCRYGGAIHVGTNRNKTSLMIKLFGLSYQPNTYWINSEEDVDEVLKMMYNDISSVISPKRLQ